MVTPFANDCSNNGQYTACAAYSHSIRKMLPSRYARIVVVEQCNRDRSDGPRLVSGGDRIG